MLTATHSCRSSPGGSFTAWAGRVEGSTSTTRHQQEVPAHGDAVQQSRKQASTKKPRSCSLPNLLHVKGGWGGGEGGSRGWLAAVYGQQGVDCNVWHVQPASDMYANQPWTWLRRLPTHATSYVNPRTDSTRLPHRRAPPLYNISKAVLQRRTA